jgi:hypothetical protein
MNIHAEQGTKVRYIGNVTEAQINLGGNDDPRGKLWEGEVYTVERIEVHNWCTEVYLQEVDGQFNVVWFEEIRKGREV